MCAAGSTNLKRSPIDINVGGQSFTIGGEILGKCSKLKEWIDSTVIALSNSQGSAKDKTQVDHNVEIDSHGRLYIEYHPADFDLLLQFLRRGELPCEKVEAAMSYASFLRIARFFGVDESPKRCHYCLAVYDPTKNELQPCLRHAGNPTVNKVDGKAVWSCCRRLCYQAGQCRRFLPSTGCVRAAHVSDDEVFEAFNRTKDITLDYTYGIRSKTCDACPSKWMCTMVSPTTNGVSCPPLAWSMDTGPQARKVQTDDQQFTPARDIPAASVEQERLLQSTARGQKHRVKPLHSIEDAGASTDDAVARKLLNNEFLECADCPLSAECLAGQKTIKAPNCTLLDLKDSLPDDKVPELISILRSLKDVKDNQSRDAMQKIRLFDKLVDLVNSAQAEASPRQDCSVASAQTSCTAPSIRCEVEGDEIASAEQLATTLVEQDYHSKQIDEHSAAIEDSPSEDRPPAKDDAVAGYKEDTLNKTSLQEESLSPGGRKKKKKKRKNTNPKETRTFKTRLCPLLRLGLCKKSEQTCSFAHSLMQLRATEDYFKTQICAFWSRGKCRAGSFCRHAHGEEELRQRQSPSVGHQLMYGEVVQPTDASRKVSHTLRETGGQSYLVDQERRTGESLPVSPRIPAAVYNVPGAAHIQPSSYIYHPASPLLSSNIATTPGRGGHQVLNCQSSSTCTTTASTPAQTPTTSVYYFTQVNALPAQQVNAMAMNSVPMMSSSMPSNETAVWSPIAPAQSLAESNLIYSAAAMAAPPKESYHPTTEGLQVEVGSGAKELRPRYESWES